MSQKKLKVIPVLLEQINSKMLLNNYIRFMLTKRNSYCNTLREINVKHLNLKRLLICLLLGVFTVLGVAGVGNLTFHTTGDPLGTIMYSGGECDVYVSFAYSITRFFPETSIDEPYTGRSYLIEWNIGGLITWIIIFSACYWLIISLIQKFRKKKLEEIR